MLGQEREHAARPQKMSGNTLDIQQIPLITRSTLHPKTIPTTEDQQTKAHRLFSGLLARRLLPGG